MADVVRQHAADSRAAEARRRIAVAHRGDVRVGLDAEELGRPPLAKRKPVDLVEDQEDAELLVRPASPVEAGLGHDPRVAEDGLDDDRGDLLAGARRAAQERCGCEPG
jgi:hypothetical protein